uniref:Uncharacterized protein n=1 Tax=Leersia perrieri TaxID=77586 RepID=A0A0D9VRP1_9ORYZ
MCGTSTLSFTILFDEPLAIPFDELYISSREPFGYPSGKGHDAGVGKKTREDTGNRRRQETKVRSRTPWRFFGGSGGRLKTTPV